VKLAYSQEDQPAFCHALKAHTAEADPRNAAVVISKTIGSIRRGARLTDRPLLDPPARRPPAGTAQLNADVSNSSVYPQDRYDRDRDWARADFDVRHVLSPNFVWNLPRETDRGWLGGWQVNGIVTLRSGVPFTPALGLTNWSRSGNTSGEDRPNLRPGVNPEDLILGRPDQYYDPSGFVLQPAGFLGNAGRNRLTGPNYAIA
jgi:hypothetical protein